MPFGPMGAFGGLTPEDKLDIGNYITSLPPSPTPAFRSASIRSAHHRPTAGPTAQRSKPIRNAAATENRCGVN